ncbi:hypothetical protein K0M31_019176 [Melipona bicolor]|uniref:Uncharacterized protein n=1 Tax=Melipona bicolor TaxID=60889 RepID=A0AA40KQV9_9HYME|nr:hypothetical protein K0M31_019176 [Melipona bicolor]
MTNDKKRLNLREKGDEKESEGLNGERGEVRVRISDYGNPFGAQWCAAAYNTRTREHVCEGLEEEEEEDMENREILRRRAGRTRAGTR